MIFILYRYFFIDKKGMLNKKEYVGLVWQADVWLADDIPFCSIFTYFQYLLIHDLALNDAHISHFMESMFFNVQSLQSAVRKKNATHPILVT